MPRIVRIAESSLVQRATTGREKGRDICVELRPGSAVLWLMGTTDKVAIDWEVVYAAALKQRFRDGGGKA